MEWLEHLVRFGQEQLSDEDREALWARGVSDDQIALYRLGALHKSLPDTSLPKDFREWCWNGRRFDDVFLLPLTNALGQVKGIQTRHIDRERSGYSDFIPGEDEPVLFGLSQAMPSVWDTGSIWLVEGGFDLFPIQRVFPNVVATLTARVTTQFARLLRRLVSEIWLGYDMDAPGRAACARVQKAHGQDFRVNAVTFPQPMRLDGKGKAKDPNELWETWGDKRLGVFLRQLADPLFQEIR